MTALIDELSFVPARELPNGELFYSPLGVFEFQAEHIAEAYLLTESEGQDGVIAVHDTGLGKTILAMDLSALLFEDHKIDLVMVVAERNKIKDWKSDIERFTALDAHLYHGAGRQKRLARDGAPHCFITTYETGRNELMTRVMREGKRGRAMIDGPLVEMLGLRSKRVLWVFDEITKLRNRSSEMHQAYAHTLSQLRRGPHHQRVLGLTATPIERDYADTYNIGRICCPSLMPTVAKFEETFTRGKDDYGRYRFKSSMKPVFAELIAPAVLRKRKTDQDVINQFPKQVEEVISVPVTGEHAKLYQAVLDLFGDKTDDPRLWLAARMTAAHPASHLHAKNEISQMIVETVGEEALRAIPSCKSVELLERLKPIVKGQGAQVIVFTFFGQTVLPEVHRELTEAGYTVATYHGGKSRHANDDAKDRFKGGHVEILLASDAAAKGLNLAEAEYVIEYESALTYANRVQRINRVHRIDSQKPIVTCFTMIAEGTVEERIFENTLRRNADMDTLLQDEDDGSEFISAAQRKAMFTANRKR